MPKTLTLTEAYDLACSIFEKSGINKNSARILGRRIQVAERQGPASHGFAMLPNYVSSVRCGWANGDAHPHWEKLNPSVLSVDGDNGFAPIALSACDEEFREMVRHSGIASLCIFNAHHIAALRSDVEPFADEGLVAITCITTRCWMAPWGGDNKMLGTNPMAFACPRKGKPPIVWDQASSVIAISDVRMAAERGESFDRLVGIDPDGRATNDAALAMENQTMLPFGEHKGTAIALMIEVLAGALTKGRFSFEDMSPQTSGAASANGGQMLIGIDPSVLYGEGFAERLEPLLAAFESNSPARIPGDGRFARQTKAENEGVGVSDDLWNKLQALLTV